MKIAKGIVLVVSVIVVAGMLYLWGHTDGRTGKAIGLPDVAVADEGSPKFSPATPRSGATCSQKFST